MNVHVCGVCVCISVCNLSFLIILPSLFFQCILKLKVFKHCLKKILPYRYSVIVILNNDLGPRMSLTQTIRF